MKKFYKSNKYIILLCIFFVVVLSLTIYRLYSGRIIEISDEEIALAGGITPYMFGAKGDGVTNDTKAVQAAIDYASRKGKDSIILIPEGVFSVKDLKYRENIKIIGSGEKSVLLADPSCVSWSGILHCNKVNSIYIQNVTFDGNKPIVEGDTSKGTVLVWIDSCKNVNITDCTFRNNLYLGICIKKSKDIVIERNKFLELDCGILTADLPSSNILINDNYFDGAEYSEPISIYAMKAGYHENITITNNVIKNHTKGSGILIRAAKSVVVKNNTIDNCCTGIYLTSSKYSGVEYGVYDTIIEENIITNCIYEGVLIENFNNSKLIKNTIQDSGVFGILVKGSIGSEVNENNLLYTNISNTKRTPYNGFSITIRSMVNSSVKTNKINIIEGTIASDRTPIIINENSATPDANNEFANNVVNPATVNVFAVRNN